MKLAKVVLAVAALGVACGGGSSEPAKPAPAAAKPAAAAPATASSSTGAVASGDFGVPECDDYFKKYFACVDTHAPEAARPMLKQSIEQTKASMKQAASTPQGKAGLAMACTQALATAKQAMTAYSCSW